MLLSGAKGRGREMTLPHPEKKARYKEAALFEGIGGSSSTTLAFRDTEDDLQIFLKILSLHKYCSHSLSRSGYVRLVDN
jgi:hypothetical protein